MDDFERFGIDEGQYAELAQFINGIATSFSEGDPDVRADISQEMWCKGLTLRSGDIDTPLHTLKTAMLNHARNFVGRSVWDAPLSNGRCDHSRMTSHQE